MRDSNRVTRIFGNLSLTKTSFKIQVEFLVSNYMFIIIFVKYTVILTIPELASVQKEVKDSNLNPSNVTVFLGLHPLITKYNTTLNIID